MFWEQQGLQTFGQRIQITRPQASQPAFDRHFSQITEEYGPTHAINLLGSKDHEATLTAAYDRHLQAARSVFGEDVGITHFDFHASAKSTGWENVTRELRFVNKLNWPHMKALKQSRADIFRASGITWIASDSACLKPTQMTSSPSRKGCSASIA